MLCTAPGIYLTWAVREWRKNKNEDIQINVGMERFESGFISLDVQRVYYEQLTWVVGCLHTAEWKASLTNLGSSIYRESDFRL